MTKRINIVLPVKTIELLDRVAPKADRSRLISEAVIHYVTNPANTNVAERLKQGAIANAQRDLAIAQEWTQAAGQTEATSSPITILGARLATTTISRPMRPFVSG